MKSRNYFAKYVYDSLNLVLFLNNTVHGQPDRFRSLGSLVFWQNATVFDIAVQLKCWFIHQTLAIT